MTHTKNKKKQKNKKNKKKLGHHKMTLNKNPFKPIGNHLEYSIVKLHYISNLTIYNMT